MEQCFDHVRVKEVKEPAILRLRLGLSLPLFCGNEKDFYAKKVHLSIAPSLINGDGLLSIYI